MGQWFSDMSDHGSDTLDETQCDNILLSLPVELLAHIVSFLTTTRDRVALWNVSRRLRSATEVPSLWNEFVWTYYRSSDEGCMNNVLKVCGQHVKQLSFPHHVTPSKLVKMLDYCNNVIELSLPTTKLNPDQLETVVQIMTHLQKLEVWLEMHEIIQVLELVKNLTELTIRLQIQDGAVPDYSKKIYSWVDCWVSNNYHPPNLTIVTRSHSLMMNIMWKCWESCHELPSGCTACLRLYRSFKSPLEFYPVTPDFQIDFNDQVSIPMSTRLLLLKEISHFLVLVDGNNAGKVIHKASLLTYPFIVHHYHAEGPYSTISNLEFVTDFNVSFGALFNSEHLEQLAVTCPNLQRLSLCGNKQSLGSLQGLRTIASSCQSLRGLNLSDIPVSKVESQIKLWEILSGMKLIHLAMESCAIFPFKPDDKLNFVSLVRKCTSLQAIETLSAPWCGTCCSICVDYSLLNLFSSLNHCITYTCSGRHHTALQDVVTSCKGLQYLHYTDNSAVGQSLSQIQHCQLRQLHLQSNHTYLPGMFMSTISAHGGLVHVVLCVRSVTIEGVTVLVRNSPNLITLQIVVDDGIYNNGGTKLNPLEVEARVEKMLSCRYLGHCEIVQCENPYRDRRECMDYKHSLSTDLYSIW